MNIIVKYLYHRTDVIITKKIEDGYIFLLSNKPIRNAIIVGKEHETLEISFKTLIKLIRDMMIDKLIDKTEKFFEDIKNLNYYKTEVLDKEYNRITKRTIKVLEKEEIVLSNEENKETSSVEDRVYSKTKSFQVEKSIIKVIIDSNIYLYGHYNSADLTMLED
jgi:hypothetical protein